jgi:hypothetical protein
MMPFTDVILDKKIPSVSSAAPCQNFMASKRQDITCQQVKVQISGRLWHCEIKHMPLRKESTSALRNGTEN